MSPRRRKGLITGKMWEYVAGLPNKRTLPHGEAKGSLEFSLHGCCSLTCQRQQSVDACAGVHESVHVPNYQQEMTLILLSFTNKHGDICRSPGRHVWMYMKQRLIKLIKPSKVDHLGVCHWLWIRHRLVPHTGHTCLPCLLMPLYLLCYFPKGHLCLWDWPKATDSLCSHWISGCASSVLKHGLKRRKS